MTSTTYFARRDQLEQYFDRTAVEMWKRMTSDAPLSRRPRDRARRARRDARDHSRLAAARPSGGSRSRRRLRDRRARVRTRQARRDGRRCRRLANSGRTRAGKSAISTGRGAATFAVGDMLDSSLGEFDYVVAMDSLIHYEGRGHRAHRVDASHADAIRDRLHRGASHTGATVMHALGKAFPPRQSRSIDSPDLNACPQAISRTTGSSPAGASVG